MPTRRQFAQAVTAGLALGTASQSATTLTAAQVIARIKENVGVPWRSETVDTIKAGSPDTPVTGIATTMMATFDVLQRAAAAKRNLVITHEPTFYSHEDKTDELTNDPVFQAKHAFIEKNNLVVFRFHDHIHARKPDGILLGMTNALGWTSYQSPDNPHLFTPPPQTLDALARGIQNKLQIRTMRVIGDHQLKVTRVALSPGYGNPVGMRRALSNPQVDVAIIGEAREWEGIEYAQDAIAAGLKKGLIVMGHVVSEESGMKECARWLGTFISEAPIEFIPANEPFWRPA